MCNLIFLKRFDCLRLPYYRDLSGKTSRVTVSPRRVTGSDNFKNPLTVYSGEEYVFGPTVLDFTE